MAKPPVCKIMDYGKFKYEEKKKAKEAKRKKQSVVEIKRIKLRPEDRRSRSASSSTRAAHRFLPGRPQGEVHGARDMA